MEFGLSKCALLIMKRDRFERSEGIDMPNGEIMKSIDEGEGYKYLGILEADGIKHGEMKETVNKEYVRRIRKVEASKLNGGNIITAINSWAVSVIRYGAGIINWRKAELQQMDRKTRKLLTMYGAHHPQADIDRLHLRRADGGRGLISIEDCVRIEQESLLRYIEQSKEKLILAVGKEEVLKTGTGEENKEGIQKEHAELRRSKPLHGQFEKATMGVCGRRSWDWLKKGHLKKETGSTIVAAQDQAIRTNNIRKHIHKEDVSSLCRMCGKFDKTIAHIVAECPSLAQNEYQKWRHDQEARMIHWKLCEKWGFERGEMWYTHNAEKVLESNSCKILWDFSIQTDKKLKHNKPDITVIDKVNKHV